MTKTTTKFPKFYLCKYGAFYEGQILAHYCLSGGHYCYVNNVILVKFVVHYYNYVPELYFQVKDVNKTQIFTLPVDMLGINYRKK